MDKQTRIGRLVRQFLEGRFSASTEQRVQRWLVEERDDEEKEAASLEFWESLAEAPASLSRSSWERVKTKAGVPAERKRPAHVPSAEPALEVPARLKSAGKRPAAMRRWASIAAAIAVPLMAAAGGLIYYVEVVRPEQEAARAAAGKTAIEVVANEPLIFEGASVEKILEALEQRFDVTIAADEKFYHAGELYTVKFPRNDSLEDILTILKEVIGEFDYTKTGNNITIVTK